MIYFYPISNKVGITNLKTTSMKKLTIVLFTFLSIGMVISAQNEGKSRAELRKEKKEQREKEMILNKEIAMFVLESRQWVLEADALQDRYGETFIIESNLNFVGVNKEEATVQLGVSDEMGLNGVGGITLDGKIGKYELNPGKKPNSGITLNLSVSGAVMGHVTINFSISADGNATATVNGMDGARLTYRGRIVPLAESTVYKGSSFN